MSRLLIVLALAGAPAAVSAVGPFTVHDLVRLERVSDPQLSPGERFVAYQLRQTDYTANKGVHGLWLLDLAARDAAPRRLTAESAESNTPRWSRDGRLYFLSTRSGSQQVWRLDPAGGEARQVTKLPLDVGAFRVAPDGRRLVVAGDVFPDCDTLACTKKRADEKAASKATGQIHDRLFVRHWDAWATGMRSQLFALPLDAEGLAGGEPRLLTAGIDGDVPPKPFGGDEEFVFAPDGKTVFFTARIAGKTEAWSTNTDVWQVAADGSARPVNLTPDNPGYDTMPAVSPDGRALAWLSMKRGGFEADRNRILVRELASGSVREVAAAWDRSALALQWSHDSRTLYVTADDVGQRPLFAVNAKTGDVRKLTGPGFVSGFSTGEELLAYAEDTLASPAQLFRIPPKGGKAAQLTRHNAELLAHRTLGAPEQFSFKGWNGETVYAYVVKPAGLPPGRKAPVAFFAHGGPQASFGNHWHYRWNPQTYAGRGYAFVSVDFHGSPGYGQAFTDSISNDWSGKPLEDLQKGWAAALGKYDFLDGSRACALGASYGGYMMNWIAGQWPDAFRCLINHDGIFDTRFGYYSTEELWFPEWEFGGPQYAAPENFEKHNPINHVANWKTPMLVIHGGLDYRLPDTQGIAAFTALQRRGIESRFLYFPNENHWILKPQNSVQWHETVEGWLQRWLQP